MRPQCVISIAALVLACAGCASNPLSVRERILEQANIPADDFLQIYEVSIESLVKREKEVRKSAKLATKGIRQAISETPKAKSEEAVLERLDRIDYVADELYKARVDIINRLRDVYNPKTDNIVFYESSSEGRRKSAWAVIRGNEVVNEMVLTDFKEVRVPYYDPD